jgi:biopolymer transport protein TolQ
MLALQETTTAAETVAETVELDPISLILNASGPVFVVVWLLIIVSVLVWFVGALKWLQLRRWSKAEDSFEIDAAHAESGDHLLDIAKHHTGAPGARVVLALEKRRAQTPVLESIAKRAIVEEQKHASSMLSLLASIGSSSPFIGLFGTVYGIMDAFLRIGREKSASLPVVAPAIGEALIATAIGLVAAIPAVIIYNALSKRLDDLMMEVETSAEGWVAQVGVIGRSRA